MKVRWEVKTGQTSTHYIHVVDEDTDRFLKMIHASPSTNTLKKTKNPDGTGYITLVLSQNKAGWKTLGQGFSPSSPNAILGMMLKSGKGTMELIFDAPN